MAGVIIDYWGECRTKAAHRKCKPECNMTESPTSNRLRLHVGFFPSETRLHSVPKQDVSSHKVWMAADGQLFGPPNIIFVEEIVIIFGVLWQEVVRTMLKLV